MKKLLIIEDDEVYAQGLARSLSRRDYECQLASDLKSARSTAELFKPTHILLDLNLGREHSQDLIPELIRMLPQCCLVVLTGHGTIPSAVQAVRDGAVSYLTKPASPEEIDHALGRDTLQRAPTPALWDLEQDHIMKVLEECGGNVSEAARRLGLHRRTLQRRLNKN